MSRKPTRATRTIRTLLNLIQYESVGGQLAIEQIPFELKMKDGDPPEPRKLYQFTDPDTGDVLQLTGFTAEVVKVTG